MSDLIEGVLGIIIWLFAIALQVFVYAIPVALGIWLYNNWG